LYNARGATNANECRLMANFVLFSWGSDRLSATASLPGQAIFNSKPMPQKMH